MRSLDDLSSLRPDSGQLDFFSRFLCEETGIVSGEEHRVTLESRVVMFCRESGLSPEDAIRLARKRNKRHLLEMISALTNGETSFFRNRAVFDCIEERILPELARCRASSRRLRIWSAACSTGQEAYSVGMLLSEKRELDEFQISIFATDISEQRLQRVREASYSKADVSRGLSGKRLLEHMTQMGGGFVANDRLRSMVLASRLNLLSPWPQLPMMDFIMIRNVMMYWGPETRAEVLSRVTRQLAPDGFIVFGSAENWESLSHLLPPVFDERAGVFGRTTS